MKSTIILALLCFPLGVSVVAQGNNIRIAKYKGDKTCAISYTFDDGLKEHYTQVAPRLNRLGLKGTFFINGSRINQDDEHVTDTIRMTWKHLKEMAASGHEISNHGWAHKNFAKFSLDDLKDDIYKNDSAILANIGSMPRTFAYPNNTKTPEGLIIASENRVGTRTFQRSIGGWKTTAENLQSWVDKLLKEQDWGVSMTHGITYGYDHFNAADLLWEHLATIKSMEDKIWIGTFREVAAYIAERDSTTFQVKEKNKGHYAMLPQCPLDRTIFTEPLTAVIECGDSKKVKIRQGRNKLLATIQSGKLVFDFDPFGGVIDIEYK